MRESDREFVRLRAESEEACVFCAIEAADASAVVFGDERTVVFLDRRPLFWGHCLVIPRRHVVTLPDLPADLLDPLFRMVQRVAGSLPRATGSDGTFVAINNVVSQSVAHLHVHVVPRRKGDGLKGFFWPRQPYGSAEEKESMRQAIAR